MGDAIGLSIGATRFAGVQLSRAAVTRTAMPGVVERVGDPVGVAAADGSIRRPERLVADALRGLLYDVTGGHAPARPPVVTYPAHWRKTQVDALRSASPGMLIPDAASAITALQSGPGLPARGVIVLCDFGGSGTSVSVLDAARGYAPVGPTVHHTDFSGDLIDRVLLIHVVSDLSGAVAVDATGTAALGPLQRLRADCRAAKQRLSSVAVTTLHAQLPRFSGDVRVTRTELDELIRGPLADLLRVVDDTINRAGVARADVTAIASVGGGARMPRITTALSEHFRVPVITTRWPELAAADGAARRAAWGPADDGSTEIAPVPVAAPPLAWSEAHDVPSVATPVVDEVGLSGARPQLEFEAVDQPGEVVTPWYRRGSTLAGTATAAVLLLAASAVVAFGSDSPTAATSAPLTPSTTTAAPAPAAAAPVAAPAPAAVDEQPQPQHPPRTVYVSPAPRRQAPITQNVAPAPAPSPESPPPPPSPSSAPPPPQTETQTVTATVTPPPTSTRPPVTFTFPPIPPIPGLNPPHNR